jgi:histidinol-phosphate phosphatase family protein
MNKALFLDLDHTLIRPKKQHSGMVVIPNDCTDAEEKEHLQFVEGTLPKHIEEIEVFEEVNHGVLMKGFSYRPIFPRNGEDWEFLPGIVDCLKPYAEEGFMFIIVTNQGGISAGFHTYADVRMKLNSILVELEKQLGIFGKGERRSSWFLCPSMDEADTHRKPNPGMIEDAVNGLNVDLALSLMVGDMDSDRECAKRAGVSYMDVQEFLRTHA